MTCLFSTFLAIIFADLITVVTGFVIVINTVPWYLLFFVVLIILLGFSVLVTVLYLVLLYQQLKSIKPIRISHGTVGSFKAATRTDYFSSLMMNCINSILAFA